MVIWRGRRREHPKDTSEVGHVTFGHYRCCACAHPREPEGVKWPLVTSGSHGTTTKKKTASGQGIFWSRDWRHFRSKGPIRVDMAPLPVAHAENILPVTSLLVTWLPVAPYSTSANVTWALPIYYLCLIIFRITIPTFWNFVNNKY